MIDPVELQQAYNTETVKYFFKAFDDLPTWADFVQHIEASKQRGDIDLRRKYYMRAPITADDTAKHFSKLVKPVQLMADQINKRISPLNAYINLATNEEYWPAHADEEDALFIQCEGTVRWVLDSGVYDLSPGDAIYFPSGTMHQVIALTPRAAIIVGID